MHEKIFVKKILIINFILFSFLDISYNKENFENKKGIFNFTLKGGYTNNILGKVPGYPWKFVYLPECP